PFSEQAQQGPHFARLGLRVVAIEIQVLRVRTPAHLRGPILVRAIPAAKAFMPVDIQHRDEYERRSRERAFGRTALHHLAKREKARILAVDLSRVNAPLHHNDRAVSFSRGGRVEDAVRGGDEHMHRPALRRASELRASDRRCPARLEGRAQMAYFLVAPRSLEARSLGERREWTVSRADAGGE